MGAFARGAVRLAQRAATADVVTVGAGVTLADRPLRLHYRTRTGALLRIDGDIAGAFDAKHPSCDLGAFPGEHELTLEVERRALPIAGLPSGDGLRWRLMLARAVQAPSLSLQVDYRGAAATPAKAGAAAAFGHAHLDVAWLWTEAETKRKALRTFATAVREVEAGPFVFAQSQPQLYAWVEAADPELFARLRARIGRGWDAGVATMWVEPDLHGPSGESVLRQFAYGMRYTREKLGVAPSVVWLPDTFGFPNTLPMLAVHAGATSFATTKLEWNDTTRWPFPQFVWRADDGSALTAAVLASYEGDPQPARVVTAARRGEPLVVGFGDGGGGATDAAIGKIPPRAWTAVADWFAGLDVATLPAYTGELYLETHRGTYTTHRDVKARNAALERALAAVEEACAWCVAVRAPSSVITPLTDDLRTAWTIVLRNQFHDVLAGSSIAAVYADVHEQYDRVERIIERLWTGTQSILPRTQLTSPGVAALTPVSAGKDEFAFANEFVRARVRADGTIIELAAAEGPNVVTLGNGLAAYIDTPAAWDAWNLDSGYVHKRVAVKPRGAAIDEEGLVVRFRIGRKSSASMRIELRAGEPFLRVELGVDWKEDHVVLRVENRVAVAAREVRFGQAHGSIVRTAYPRTPAERARFEVPAQRYAHIDDGERGVAILAPDTYGWNARGLKGGGVRLGMSLLRSPRWPDPGADRGERRIAYAFAPTAGAPVSALEAAWTAYVEEPRVRLFTCDTPGVIVVATKPADDGRGVVVRVRECDGTPQDVVLRCGGRMRSAAAVDACELPVPDKVTIDQEHLLFALGAYALRSFRLIFAG
jgi:alpha-mannosidase